MELNASFPAQVHKYIDDNWLNGGNAPEGDETYGVDNVGAYVDCHKLWVPSQGVFTTMRPRGITIESGEVQGKAYAFVNGFLWEESDAYRDSFSIPTAALMHSVAFRRIYRNNTTARGIRIYG